MTEVANRFIIPGWLLLSDNPKGKSKKSSLAAQLAEEYTHSASGAFQPQLEQRFPETLVSGASQFWPIAIIRRGRVIDCAVSASGRSGILACVTWL